MDNITEKIAKVTDLSTYTDLTPEHLKKLFLEIGGSPEKLRTILNLWFVPDFKPTFAEPQDYSFGGLQDVGFLESPDTERPRRPLRLIDLETGNLVDVWNTIPSDSYCMLSHRWKGDEITLAQIKRAREKHLERSRNGVLLEFNSDISIVLEQSRLDVEEQEQMIESLLGDNLEGRTVDDLLQMRLNASDAKSQVNWARQNRDAKRSKVERCMMEKDMFDHLMSRIQKDISDDREQVTGQKSTTSPLVEEAEAEYTNAQKSLEMSIENRNKANQDAEFFGSDRRLGDAVDEMMSRLQRWKSAIKLERSMNEASDIFKSNLFPKQGACYIWSDTCCIDKLNYGELSQSLSLMGDWYANAEFCLVHLDTDWRTADAIHDWKQFKGEAVQTRANITSFEAIEGTTPEWSNRAWTLQELVMSKMAYFTNSEWKSLSRPVQSLGYIYPLIPFIHLYTCSDIGNLYSKWNETNALNSIRDSAVIKSFLKKNDVVVTTSDDGDQSTSEAISTAVQLISILQALGFIFPRAMTTETALPEMCRAVYFASHNLVKYEDSPSEPAKGIFVEINRHMPSTAKREGLTIDMEAQNVINFLLHCLIKISKDLVLKDRRSIASFGQVNPLDSWKQGIARSGFSAERVLQLSCRRKATVPVDHVYSLMGILGVRFQSFHAEGYAKALSRLLDEVVISHNDVSVFNWAGAFMGSPIRGRSMYPASHKAYANEEDSGRRYNMMISAEVQRKRKDVMVAYQGIITMLRDAIDYIKEKGCEGLPLDWVREICTFVKQSTFESLGPVLENIGKILRYIQDYCVKPEPVSSAPLVQNPAPVAETESPVSDAKVGAGSGWGFNKPTLPSMNVGGSLKTPKLPGFGVASITKPSFGRHHSELVEKAVVPEPVSPPKPSVPEVPEWLSLDQDVKAYLASLMSNTITRSHLPTQIQELEAKRLTPEVKDERASTGYTSFDDDFTCPNPIIINNSGIEGIFDIQRIVVTMIDREKLVRQVSKASSPKQKISGWCIISTGFASVVVNFACEQHTLKTQLDVEQAVEDKIIKGDRASKLRSDLQIQVTGKSNDNDGPSAKEAPSSEAEDETGKSINSSKPTKDELAIVRIIDFIQEPQLQLVAGEWVLARFSGTSGAQWFLCYLELGSTHSFYGHRISASDINFNNSSIEPGLMNAWKVYMTRKKRKMCNILDKYIKGSTSAMKSKERLNKSSEIANENYARFMDAGSQSLDRVKSMGSASVSPSMFKLPFTESSAKDSSAKDLDSDCEADDGKGLFDGLLDQGKEATAALGEYTVLAAYEMICGMHAQHLDKHLATSVLKRTPKSLQTAVESVDENKGFLPAMFHSSRRVHMF
ncbi:hypothetical protein NW768_002657 [Fusarium equiseti]|uniref:Heterokaryon incompatibility domain-containing protein n=1 Tax=Fusarium equiseti TaxID=61235 RepID=A0ABQ8RPE1_FUSEQ|nr:hypothetical protein NW768_002657 [Fusarium equiseti]